MPPAGQPFSVDPSSFRLLGDYGATRFLDEVAGAAALFPNREGTTLTGHEDPDRAAVALARRFPVVAFKPARAPNPQPEPLKPSSTA